MIVGKLRGARLRKKAKRGRCEGQHPFGSHPGEPEAIRVMQQLRSKRPKLPSGADPGRVGDFCRSNEVSTCFQVDTSSTGAWWNSGGLRGGLERVGQVPGQQLANAVDGVIGDLAEHGAQVEFRIEAVELGRADQRVDGGGALAA